MPDGTAEPIARRIGIGRTPGRAASTFVPRLLAPALVAATMTVLIAAPDTRPQLPPGCAIGWTMVGGVLIYVPDCTHRTQAPPPPPAAPPPPEGPPPPPEGPPPPGPVPPPDQ